MALQDRNNFLQQWKDQNGNLLIGVRRDGAIQFQDGSAIWNNEGDQFQVMAADGTVTIDEGAVLITKTSQANITVNAPTPGSDTIGDDGDNLRFVATTNFAHIITFPLHGLITPAGVKNIVTMVPGGAALSCSVIAYNGLWYLFTLTGGTVTGS